MKKKIILGVVALFLLIQLFQIDTDNPPIDSSLDFIIVTNPPEQIRTILKTACYRLFIQVKPSIPGTLG